MVLAQVLNTLYSSHGHSTLTESSFNIIMSHTLDIITISDDNEPISNENILQNKTNKLTSDVDIIPVKRHKSSSGIASTLAHQLTTTLHTDIQLSTTTTNNKCNNTCCYKHIYKWSIHDKTLHILQPTNYKVQYNKILGIDMDSTLIKTKSGRKFPINTNDWQWWSDTVINKIQIAYNNKYQIIIISNQSGISNKTTGHIKQQQIYNKLCDIVQSIELCNIPIISFVAGADDKYRKPNTSILQYYIQQINNNQSIDINNSIFIGDAAGRIVNYNNTGRVIDLRLLPAYGFGCSNIVNTLLIVCDSVCDCCIGSMYSSSIDMECCDSVLVGADDVVE